MFKHQFIALRTIIRNSTRNYCRKDSNGAVKLSYATCQSTHAISHHTHPLLIMHGMMGSRRNWQSLAKAFSRTGRKIVTVDLRNHGESPHAEAMDYMLMSEDVEELMNDLKMKKAVLLGHSMGGRVAMAVALLKPHLVDKLIVEDVSPRSDVSRSTPPEFLMAMRDIAFNHHLPMPALRKMVDEQLRETIPDSDVRQFILMNIMQEDSKYRWSVNLESVMKNLQHLIRFPEFHTCYKGDALFVGGSKSPEIKESDYPEIYRLFPEAKVKFIDNAGHWVHSEKPYDFMKVVLQFLDGNVKL